MHANDNRVLREAALRGIGIAVLPRFLVNEDLKAGRLQELMPSHPIADLLDEGAGAAYQTRQAGRLRARQLPEGADATVAAVGSDGRAPARLRESDTPPA